MELAGKDLKWDNFIIKIEGKGYLKHMGKRPYTSRGIKEAKQYGYLVDKDKEMREDIEQLEEAGYKWRIVRMQDV